jgi:hypothetical protein
MVSGAHAQVRDRPSALLVNPPLWNPYAPYLAVPLLVAALMRSGWPARGVDLNIELIDWLLRRPTLEEMEPRLDARLGERHAPRAEIERALLVLPAAAAAIEAAKATLRSADALARHDEYLEAHVTLRDCLWVIAAAFPAVSFDITAAGAGRAPASCARALELSRSDDAVYGWAFERIAPPHLADPRLSLVGISLTADAQLVPALALAALCKRLRPDVRLVAGGNFATRMASRWTGHHPFLDVFDAFLLYEGEESLPLLCEAWFEGSTREVPGLIVGDGRTLRRTPARDVQLDEEPLPVYDDMPLGSYLAPGPILPLLSSRGCAWNCAFCSIPFASGGFRRRSASRVVDDMEALAARHGTRYFMFVDEIMTMRSMREVATELVRRESDLRWYAETRFSSGWTQELADLLHAAGCRRLDFGLESFNQRMLDRMRKATKVAYIPRNVEVCLRAGIPVHLFAIVGFPGETEAEATRTVQFAQGVVRRSVELFDLPYSTWGASPFLLDAHSPIAQHPAEYGVAVTPAAADQDLTEVRDYHVTDGMSAQDVRRYFASRSRRAGRSAAVAEALWFHESASKECEEEMFLRACLDAGAPGSLRRGCERWPHDLDDEPVRLADAVVARRCSRGWAWRGERPVLALYCGRRGYVIELDVEAAPWVASLREPRCFGDHAAGVPPSVASALGMSGGGLLRLLARHGFLAWPRGAPSRAFDARLEYDRAAAYRQEPFVLDEREAGDGSGHLVNRVSGVVARSNATAAELWRWCSTDRTAPELHAATSAPRHAIAHALHELVDYGFLYVEDPAPVTSARRRAADRALTSA